MSIINTFIQNAKPYWQEYTEHQFVQQLAQGTLPKACFQHYLKQDYCYLLHYVRALFINQIILHTPERLVTVFKWF